MLSWNDAHNFHLSLTLFFLSVIFSFFLLPRFFPAMPLGYVFDSFILIKCFLFRSRLFVALYLIIVDSSLPVVLDALSHCLQASWLQHMPSFSLQRNHIFIDSEKKTKTWLCVCAHPMLVVWCVIRQNNLKMT